MLIATHLQLARSLKFINEGLSRAGTSGVIHLAGSCLAPGCRHYNQQFTRFSGLFQRCLATTTLLEKNEVPGVPA